MDIPQLGLGTWKIPKDAAADLVFNAIKEGGVRHIDCACDYGNEVQVGAGIRRAISEGVVRREDLWVTSKLWNTFHRREHVELACRKTLTDLGLDYLDLYLIHFPISQKFVPIEVRYPPEWIHDPSAANPRIELDFVSTEETWVAMEALVGQGICKRIGVCNFNVQQLMNMMAFCKIKPYLNQVEIHPLNSQEALVRFCDQLGIRVTSFSPLGSPSYIVYNMDRSLGQGLLEDPAILAMASKHGKSSAQVVIRWGVQRGYSIIPKSNRLERIKENVNVYDFELSADEMEVINNMNKNMRFNDPGEFCKGMGGAIPIYN